MLEPGESARLEIETIRDETKRLLEAGENEKAGERFMDYWIGPGAWLATAESARAKIAKGMGKVRFEWGSGFDPKCSVQQIQALSMPILLLPDQFFHPWRSRGVTKASSESELRRVERSGSHGSSNPSGCCQPRDSRFHQQGPKMIA